MVINSSYKIRVFRRTKRQADILFADLAYWCIIISEAIDLNRGNLFELSSPQADKLFFADLYWSICQWSASILGSQIKMLQT